MVARNNLQDQTRDMLPPVRVPQIVAPFEESVEDEEIFVDAEGYDDSEMNEIEEDEDDMEMSLVDKFSGGFKKNVPQELDLFVWKTARKEGKDFAPDDWKTIKVGQLVKTYNSHVSAAPFCAQEPDPEAPDLLYRDKRDMEKQLKVCQNTVGGAAAASAQVLTKFQDEADILLATAKDYRDPAVCVEDPRQEVAMIMDILCSKMLNEWGKTLSDQVNMSAWVFNQLLLLRRGQYLFRVTQEKNARQIIKRLDPSTRYLFGGKIGEVSKTLKDQDQINPLANKFKSNPRGGGAGYNYSRGGGYPRGGGFNRGFSRGGYNNARLVRFGTKFRGSRGKKN